MLRVLWSAAAVLAVCASPAWATPTEVVVRVISQDAKFVGDSMGGAKVTLIDTVTETILAEGVTTGTTGDTDKIMRSAGRSPLRATEEAAAFHAIVDIDRPTLVRIEVEGPIGSPQTMQRATSERWLLPGVSAKAGDGWVLELPGLAIRLAGPALTELRRGDTAALAADVQLMCGCPITPGGLWDAAHYEVSAEVRYADGTRSSLRLPFVSAPGRFSADWAPQARGAAELMVMARNTLTGNTGVLITSLAIN